VGFLHLDDLGCGPALAQVAGDLLFFDLDETAAFGFVASPLVQKKLI
jgi:hypothetical protein